jgi:type III secretion protein T
MEAGNPMTAAVTNAPIWPLLMSLAMTQARILPMCMLIPVFSREALPGMLRYAVSIALGLIAAPMLVPGYAAADLTGLPLAMILAKEIFIGLSMGFLCAMPFWIFEAVGFVVDNQRGAGMGSMLNPASGNDSSPLGILFNQAFIVFFLVGGGLPLMLTMLYDSFKIWSVWEWTPALRAESIPVVLDQFSRMARMFLLLAAPAVLSMFLSELGLALVGRFVPQLQVFFLAMPIKSGVAMLVLVLYMSTLFHYAGGLTEALGSVVPLLDGLWRSP